PDTQVVDLPKASNGIDYQLYVHVPPACKSVAKKCPVVYMLDAEYSFPLAATIVTHLSDRQRIPPLISVAIGYPDKSHYHLDRTRDYTPFFFAEGGYGAEMQKVSGGGPAFLKVIEDEVIPYVEKHYPASAEHRTLVGHSYGGLFATYAWIDAPSSFENFLIVSPSLWYANRKPLQAVAEACRESAFAEERKLFLAVGSFEEQPENNRRMVSDLRAMNDELMRCGKRKVASRIEVFEDETHASIFPTALSTGLRAFYQ
ncbi:MAG: alpha/beta hydrolase, partial [Xanthomonadales bacterium]|nr:alpha/beta hydrolase [Xanthomonadales bacterium]